MIKIAIVDDNFEVLNNFSNHFKEFSDVELVNISTTIGHFFRANIAPETLDILFLDISLPEETGLEALPKIKERFPNTEIIIFTVHEESELLIEAFSKGASGYLLKDISINNLYDYIQVTQKGGSAISASMAQKLMKHFGNSAKNVDAAAILNEKEFQVLQLLAEGWSYKLIATKTGLSIDGVRFYIKRIYRALDVNSKGEAIRVYYKGDYPN